MPSGGVHPIAYDIIAIEGDMLPAERRDAGDKVILDGFATRAQIIDGAAEIDGVPKDDGGHGEIEAGSAVTLVFKSAIADFPETMEEHSARERVAGLAFVESGVGPSAQGGVADPPHLRPRSWHRL